MIPNFLAIMVYGKVTLKWTDRYYYQVQGQMALAGVKWCDLIIFTFKNHTVKGICFDCDFRDDIQTRLTAFSSATFFQHQLTLESNCSEIFLLPVYVSIVLVCQLSCNTELFMHVQ